MDPVLVHIGYHKTGTNWVQRVWWSKPKTVTASVTLTSPNGW